MDGVLTETPGATQKETHTNLQQTSLRKNIGRKPGVILPEIPKTTFGEITRETLE